MNINFPPEIYRHQYNLQLSSIEKTNQLSLRYGLSLSANQIENLLERRSCALKNAGRLEFGEGILPKLIYALCDSPYVMQENYETILADLQDVFYYFKSESLDTVSDDNLISAIEKCFNADAGGSAEYFSMIPLDELLEKFSDEEKRRG